MTRPALFLSVFTLLTHSVSAQVEINELQRYIDANTLVLNEPCIESGGKLYKGQFSLDQSAGLKLNLLSAEELTETRAGCIQILAGSTASEIKYDITNLVVADGNMDTGQRYDIQSTADATKLEEGFTISTAEISAPSLVYASNLELPLNAYNEAYLGGLEICLSAIGANTISINNASHSLDLSLRDETATGIKRFCGTIEQLGLQNGEVSYSARINDSIDIPDAVAYWNPQCIAEDDSSLCGFRPPEPAMLLGGMAFNFTLRLAGSSTGVRAFLSNETSFRTTDTEMQPNGDRFQASTILTTGPSVYRTYVVSPTGMRSLILGTQSLN